MQPAAGADVIGPVVWNGDHAYTVPEDVTVWYYPTKDCKYPLTEMGTAAGVRALLRASDDGEIKAMGKDVNKWMKEMKTDPRRRFVLIIRGTTIIAALYLDAIEAKLLAKKRVPLIRVYLVRRDLNGKEYGRVLAHKAFELVEDEDDLAADVNKKNGRSRNLLELTSATWNRGFRRLGLIVNKDLVPDDKEGTDDDEDEDLIEWGMAKNGKKDLKDLLLAALEDKNKAKRTTATSAKAATSSTSAGGQKRAASSQGRAASSKKIKTAQAASTPKKGPGRKPKILYGAAKASAAKAAGKAKKTKK